jgi:NAD+ kinase
MTKTRGVRRISSAIIVAKRGQAEARRAAGRLARWLAARAVRAAFDTVTARALGRPREGRALGAGTPPDLYVVFGGDGTLLMVARSTAAAPRPILGVNLGGLGFLTETRLDQSSAVLEDVLAGRYTLDRRMTLDVQLIRGGRAVMRQTVLNDLVINKSALARIIDLGLSIDRRFVAGYRADGLIVATPTGSTAYALSAGGPIIHPNMGALLIAPICPHTLSLRPIVLPDTARVEITLRTGDSEVYLTLDGQVGHPLRAGDRVRGRRGRQPVLMVRTRRDAYFEVLRHKLHWGQR